MSFFKKKNKVQKRADMLTSAALSAIGAQEAQAQAQASSQQAQPQVDLKNLPKPPKEPKEPKGPKEVLQPFDLAGWADQNKTVVADLMRACAQCDVTRDIYKLLNDKTKELVVVIAKYWIPGRDAFLKNYNLQKAHYDTARAMLQQAVFSLVKQVVELNNKPYNITNDDFVKFYTPEAYHDIKLYSTAKLCKLFFKDWIGKRFDTAEKKFQDRIDNLSKTVEMLSQKHENAKRGELLTIPTYSALRRFSASIFLLCMISPQFTLENRASYTKYLYDKGDADGFFKASYDVWHTVEQINTVKTYFVYPDSEKLIDLGRVYGERGNALLNYVKTTVSREDKVQYFERVKKVFKDVIQGKDSNDKQMHQLAQTALDKLSTDILENNAQFYSTVLLLSHVDETGPGVLLRHFRYCALLQEVYGVKKLDAAHFNAAINVISAVTKLFVTAMVKAQVAVDPALEKRNNYCDNVSCLKQDDNVKLLRCSGCKMRRYCSGQCQTQDWTATHKVACKTGAEMIKANAIVI